RALAGGHAFAEDGVHLLATTAKLLRAHDRQPNPVNVLSGGCNDVAEGVDAAGVLLRPAFVGPADPGVAAHIEALNIVPTEHHDVEVVGALAGDEALGFLEPIEEIRSREAAARFSTAMNAETMFFAEGLLEKHPEAASDHAVPGEQHARARGPGGRPREPAPAEKRRCQGRGEGAAGPVQTTEIALRILHAVR